jgi:FkbM family methyltransferase
MSNMKSPPPHLTYDYKVDPFSTTSHYFKDWLFERLTEKSLPLLIRGADILSMSAQIHGDYEPHIKHLIEHCANSGFSDFFIDVGANIGLTSCQSGDSFKEVHMFEPNPDCFNVLRINSKIALKKCRYVLHEYGLGDEDTQKVLSIPRHNWGGAFINDGKNMYTDMTLASKDGFELLDSANYEEVTINIKNSVEVLGKLFVSFQTANRSSGVIKIDVEGYEPIVLGAIAATIPEHFRAIIVFESWDPDFDIDAVVSQFKGRAEAFKIMRFPKFKSWVPRPIKALRVMVKGGHSTRLVACRSGANNAGDLVLVVHPVA